MKNEIMLGRRESMLTTKEVFRKYTDPETFERIREMDSVSEMWKQCVETYRDLPAVQDPERQWTYSEVEEKTSVFRTVLKKAALEKGDRVGVYMPNTLEFVPCYLAIVTSGMTAVILPPHLDETALFGCTVKFELKAVIYHPAFEEKIGFSKTHGSRAAFVSGLTAETEKTPIDGSVQASDPALIMFTGGTTGRSKGALLSNRALMQGTVNGCYGVKDVFGQRYILTLPLSHVFGLIRNLMTSLYTGSTLFFCLNNKDMFRDIAVFRPNILVTVPALAEMALTLSKKFGKNMLGPDMKTIICGAAAVPPYLIHEYDKLGITMFPGYGLTESANLVSGNPEPKRHPDSVGFLYPNQEVKIVDGELYLKGKNMMDGYVGEDEGAFEDGWFKTGDLVRLDEEGLLYITGRIKEIIVLPTGENVSPAELEAKFNELVSVQDSQVFEAINDSGDHILALEVVPRLTELSGVQNIPEYVERACREVNDKLPTHLRVSRITVRDTDFKRTPSMKIERYKTVQ